MRTTLKKVSLVSLAVLAVSTLAVAEESVDRTLKTHGRGTVEVEIGAGSVKIIGWDRGEVRIQGTVPEGEDMFEIEQDGDTISIEVALPETDCEDDDCDWEWDDDDDGDDDDGDRHRDRRRGRHSGRRTHHLDSDDTRLEIHVPHGTSLEIEGIAVEVTIEDVRGQISLEVISGDVEVSGDLSELEIEIISGDVDIRAEGNLGDVEIEAVSGTVELMSGLSPRANVDIQSVSGNIVIYLASNASCEVIAETLTGGIDSAFGERPRKKNEFMPGQSLEFTLGSGDGDVDLQTFNGSIEIREN